jgi:uncharacterized protein
MAPMIVPDVNLLVYANQLQDPRHEAAVRWLEAALSGDETVGFAGIVVYGFVRLTTNARVFPRAIGTTQAVAVVDGWLEQPSAALIEGGPAHWEILRDLLARTGVRGPDVTDAALAAIALEHDATVHTTDRDFARFPGLKWKNPLE